MSDFTLSTLIPHELNEALEMTCARRRITKKEAVRKALDGWIKYGDQENPALQDTSAVIQSIHHGSTGPISTEDLRKILDEFEARILERVAARDRSSEGRAAHPKRRAKTG